MSGSGMRKMTLGPDNPSLADRIESSLEAGCTALVILESIEPARLAGDVHGRLARAIDSLRLAIDELRVVRGTTANPLAHGFVLGRPGRGAHSKPRRTA
jgi:hypothetical protein